MPFSAVMETENEYDDEHDNTNCELVSLLMNDSRNPNQDAVEESDEETLDYVSLSKVPYNDYIVPCDDDIRTDFSEDDDNGSEIIREIELITPTVSSEFNQSDNRGLNDFIINCIQDEKIKNELITLNIQLERNIESCNKVAAEATAALLEKKALMKEYKIIEEKLQQRRPAENAKLRKIKKKKGKHCAETGHNRHTYFCRFGMPYFKNRDRYPADYNYDLRELNSRNQITLSKLPKTRRFLKNDARVLNTLILQQLKIKRVDQLNGYLKDVNKKIQLAEHDDDGHSELSERKRKILDAIKETPNVFNLDDTKDWNLKVDFTTLIKNDNYHRFNSEDFERLWNLLANPQLSRTEFTSEETTKLKDLVVKHGAQDWDRIAQLLGTNRSAFMCFTKYVSVTKKGKYIPWTREEDELLLKLGSKLKTSKQSGSMYHWWRNIRRHFPNRTYNQIHAHWSYVLAPKLKKGRFTQEENVAIQRYMKQNKSYSEIAKLIGNRSCVQIRAHLKHNECTDRIKNGPWTRDEENTLLELIREHGDKNWVTISKLMKTRTRTQCRLKYSQMKINQNANPRSESSSEEGFRKGRWTDEENELFTKLLEKYGRKWALISKEMKTRTRLQCSIKYKTDLIVKPKQTDAKKVS